MDGEGEKRARSTNPSGEVDRISDLPDFLIVQVLLNLRTKEVVKTSLLSSRWKNLWKYVPALDLGDDDFPDQDSFVSFVDSFLNFERDSCLQSFKLSTYDSSDDDEPSEDDQPSVVDEPQCLISRWLDTAAGLKVKHIDVSDISGNSWERKISPTLYTCASLESLKICGLTLSSPPERISLPSLRDMDLILVEFTDEWDLETFISGCTALENFCIDRSDGDDTPFLRVRSQSLLTFIHIANSHESFEDVRTVEIDAPKLRYLKISDGRTETFILNNSDSLVEADIDTAFNLTLERRLLPDDEPKRRNIRNFLVGISRVQYLTIASYTLEVIYDVSNYLRLPVFRNLTYLRVMLNGYEWEMLPFFLEICPNLKYLVVGSGDSSSAVEIPIFARPWRPLRSLEYVKIEKTLKGEALEMNLVAYLLENSLILKKLTLCLANSLQKEESSILNEIDMMQSLSRFCRVVVLRYGRPQ